MTVMTLAGLLGEQGVSVSEGEVVAALSEMLAGRSGPARTAALSADATAVLRAASGLDQPDEHPEQLAARDTTAAVAALVVTSRSVAEVALALGVDASRVRHRAADGALYAVRAGRAKRFPAWQFDDAGHPVVGLREVLAALPDDLHPLEVEGFMTTPQPELRLGRRTATAREWLVSGGDPAPVVALAGSLAVGV